MIDLYVGFDQREACVFHVCNQSMIEHATVPVAIHPLSTRMLDFDGQQDGSNAFTFSRYLVPHLQDFEGFAIFIDGDMHFNADIAELWALRDSDKAVQVVQHNYVSKVERKYIGTPMESDSIVYPRKNWSSVMIFNCGHPSNKLLTRQYVAETGPYIHRFNWLNDYEIGELPIEWNHLDIEYEWNPQAKLVHQTLGTPGFTHYQNCDSAGQWNRYLLNSLEIIGERPSEMVRRAQWKSLRKVVNG